MQVTYTFHIDASLSDVGRALCSEAYNLDIQRDRRELVSAQFQMIEESERQTVFELRCREYDRKKTGGLNLKKVVDTVTRSTWTHDTHELSWRYSGVGSEWVTLHGVYQVRPDKGRTEIRHVVDIQVHIPLLGAAISKLVARQLQETNRQIPAVLARHIDTSH